MLGATEAITIINHWHDPKTDAEQYACRIIQGCSWHAKMIHCVDASGLHRAEVHKIRVPDSVELSRDYREPQDWLRLPVEKRHLYWTLGCEAKVVDGEIQKITDEEYAKLARMHTVAAALSWHDNRRGNPPHWYIEGS